MTMTPKNILSKPVFGLAGIAAVIGLILFVPGGLLILGACALGSLGDKMSDDDDSCDPEDATTIEEYEDDMWGYWDSEGFIERKPNGKE